MELVNGDVARSWREQERGAQGTGTFSIKSESLGDVVANQRHCRERSILHCNKKHWMTKNCEERSKKKNDRFYVVPQQRNVFDRYVQTPMNQLPDRRIDTGNSPSEHRTSKCRSRRKGPRAR